MKKKNFCDLTMLEVMEVLTDGKMPDDGTPIDPETAKASLSRVVPMFKKSVMQDRDFAEQYKDVKVDKAWAEWRADWKKREALLAKAEKILQEA